MLDKMIKALDTHDCQRIIEAVKNNFFYLIYGENAKPDSSGDLYQAYCELKNVIDYLEHFHKLHFIDKYPLDVSDHLVLGDIDMLSIERVRYLREIYPEISLQDAKSRVDIFMEVGR